MTIFAKFLHAMRSNSAALLVANCCLVFVSPKKIMPNMQENRWRNKLKTSLWRLFIALYEKTTGLLSCCCDLRNSEWNSLDWLSPIPLKQFSFSCGNEQGTSFAFGSKSLFIRKVFLSLRVLCPLHMLCEFVLRTSARQMIWITMCTLCWREGVLLMPA